MKDRGHDRGDKGEIKISDICGSYPIWSRQNTTLPRPVGFEPSMSASIPRPCTLSTGPSIAMTRKHVVAPSYLRDHPAPVDRFRRELQTNHVGHPI